MEKDDFFVQRIPEKRGNRNRIKTGLRFTFFGIPERLKLLKELRWVSFRIVKYLHC